MRTAINSLHYDEENLFMLRPKSKYYRCKKDILPSEMQSCWLGLDCDEGGLEFIAQCKERIGSRSFADSALVLCILNACWSITDTNAILDRGKMHVLSSEQIQMILEKVNLGLL